MPELLNVDFSSMSGSTDTKMRITAYSFTPRTDVQGTACSITVRVTMASSSWVGTHSSDTSYGRQFRGTINGHDIGTHIIKPHATVAWNTGTAYTYTVTFNIPYSPGTVYANLRIERQNGTTGGTACFSMASNTYTVSSGTGSAPSAPRTARFDGLTHKDFGTLTGTFNLTWLAPSSGGTGGVKSYNIYKGEAGKAWAYVSNTTNLSVAINVASTTWAVTRGNYRWMLVEAVGLYGQTGALDVPSFYFVNYAVRPTSVTVASSAVYSQPLTVSWSGASAGDSRYDAISSYRVQVRRLPAGSSTWSSWVNATSAIASSPFTTTPSTYTAWTVRPGDTLQYQVFTKNNYPLESVDARASGTVLMKGGIMRVRVAGVWREGTAWIRVAGTWREGTDVYVRVSGAWKESL